MELVAVDAVLSEEYLDGLENLLVVVLLGIVGGIDHLGLSARFCFFSNSISVSKVWSVPKIFPLVYLWSW